MNGEPRVVVLHQTHHPTRKKKTLFIDNRIRTTKYTLFTFLPKNLFEQFSRIANFYFLIIITLLQFPWAPIAAAAAIMPLCIVIGVSAIREAIEDILRWRSDQKINNNYAYYLEGSAYIERPWKNILVGGIVKIRHDQQVPADVVLLATSNSEGIAHIDTCNLDGETNLKVRQALPETAKKTDFDLFNAEIECDKPNNLLYTFHGRITFDGTTHSLDNKQVLLRGSVLRNTDWAIGAVIYTGRESKIMMNASSARSKRSNLEKGLNWKLVSVFAFLLALVATGSILGYRFERDLADTGKHWYFFRNSQNRRLEAEAFFILVASHIIILNTMVPISLYVTLEVVRVWQALFIAWDREMYDQETDTSASPRTTNISDDLGQIEYIFSDKTGTLTKNVMEFIKCSVGGHRYGQGITEVEYEEARKRGLPCTRVVTPKPFTDPVFEEAVRRDNDNLIRHFMWLLSTCHSVMPETDMYGKVRLQSSSPDEGALVEGAANLGYAVTQRKGRSITICKNGIPSDIEILAMLEFSSERKRSSVIIRHPETDQIVLYCKGADDVIFERLAENEPNQAETKEDLKFFAATGLRTLCCAYKIIDEEFYNEWAQRFHAANCAINGREELVEAAANELEQDLHLIGATAIEDKLQDGVGDTISSLLRANIKVWVITGDKKETAINIGFACSLLTSEMQLITIDTNNADEIASILNSALEIPDENDIALVVSGTSLCTLLGKEFADKFLDVAIRCRSVICCRVSPFQKATIVEKMRRKTGKLTLAIGDGANDVGMILKADVGVGISGKEGRQAVLASDYAFGEFRFIKRLLLVHGRLNFYRNVDLIYYSFYKNIVFTFNQILYGIFSGFSGCTVFDSMLYMTYNVVFTCLPPIVFAGLERDVSLDSMMAVPELYDMDGKRKWYQSYGRYWGNIFLGLIHAAIAFFVCYFGLSPYVFKNGCGITASQFGTAVYSCVVAIANVRIAAMCHYWTWMHHFTIWGSILILPAAITILDRMGLSKDLMGTSTDLLTSGAYYLCVAGSIILSLFPVIGIDAVKSSLNTITNKVVIIEKKKRSPKFVQARKASGDIGAPLMAHEGMTNASNCTGYAFSQPMTTADLVSPVLTNLENINIPVTNVNQKVFQ